MRAHVTFPNAGSREYGCRRAVTDTRCLRPLVVARKISGGTRSARGTTTRLTLASLLGTWRAQGLNPYDECVALLTSPQV